MPQTRLTEEKVRRARDLHAKGVSQREIAKQLGSSQSAISFLLRKLTYREVAS